MAIEFQFEFPPEIQAEREVLFREIHEAMVERSLASIQAVQCRMAEWLQKHPEDYAIWDAGEPLAKLEDALLFMEQQKPAIIK